MKLLWIEIVTLLDVAAVNIFISPSLVLKTEGHVNYWRVREWFSYGAMTHVFK